MNPSTKQTNSGQTNLWRLIKRQQQLSDKIPERPVADFTSSPSHYRTLFLYTIIFSFILSQQQQIVQSQYAQNAQNINDLIHKREHSLVKPYQGAGMVSLKAV